jgi:tripartite-type tricarboxylate transporter receptor subunit TctC
VARIASDRLSQVWNQPVLIVNRPGAGGLVAAQAMSGVKPDGYTLFMLVASNFTVLAQTQEKLPIDFERDIRPVGLIGEQPFVIAVAGTLGVNTLPELLSLAQQRPSQIAYGTMRGGLPHMAMEMLRSRVNVDLTFIPYTAARQILPDVMAGRVEVLIDSMPAFHGAYEKGLIKPLAVASQARLPDYPNIPTVAETVPGYEARGWLALMAPAGTPDNVVSKVNNDLRSVLEQPEVQSKFRTLGTYTRAMSPSEVAEFIRREQRLWKPFVKIAVQ